MNKEKVLETLQKLRNESKERKFEQSLDLIVNLKNFDTKKNSINLFLELPHKVKDTKIAGFLNKRSKIIDSIIKPEFDKYKDKKQTKKLVKKYDFFISNATLMPLIASTFGRYLGQAGKMPSPQLGIIKEENETEIKKVMAKVDRVVRIKSKEPSLKFCVGKEKMKNEELAENILTSYNAVFNALPKKKENIKNVMIKFTMTKPQKIET